MYDLRMSRGASTVVNTCAGVQPGEQVLIITEYSKMSIAESLAAAAYAAGAEATLAVMERCRKYPNFVISSGCDIPPMSRWENIDAFFAAVQEFYNR